MLTHLDLFSGIGGFALAAKWAGIETIGFSEIDLFCVKLLSQHWPHVKNYGNIKEMDFPNKVDLMTGGFPCQPFSVAGKQKGFADDRYLWPELLRLIRQSKPTWFIGENVPGIIPHIDTVLQDLENEGYSWEAFLIPASAVNAPHKRERIWIIAHRNSERLHDGIDHRQERYFQDNMHRYAQTLQSEWIQFQPESWTTFNTQDWLESASDTNRTECNQRAANNEAESERFKRAQLTTEIGDVIGNPNSVTESQAYSSTDADGKQGSAWNFNARINRFDSTIFNWEKDQPPIPGVDDGLPNGVDRNKALGNAIVPQIPYIFMMLIKEIENKL